MIKFLRLVPKIDRVLLYTSWFVKFNILLIIISSFMNGRLVIGSLSIFFLAITFIPSIIKKRFRIILPPEFEIVYFIFLYASLILGELKNYYLLFPWWDIVLHGIAGLMIGLIGFTIVYSFYLTHKVVFKPGFAAVFSFSFSLAIGALWEILEFSLDSFFGIHMQRGGLTDTIGDLIFDSIGALIVAVIGYFYIKGRHSFLIERFVKKYIDLNKK